VKTKILRIACVVQGVGLILLSVIGLLNPQFAMTDMTHIHQDWSPASQALLRMQSAGDLIVAVGFFLVALNPVGSWSCFLICIIGNILHGLVHLKVLGGTHEAGHIKIMSALMFLPLLAAALYPWKESLAGFSIRNPWFGRRQRKMLVFVTASCGLLFIIFGIMSFFFPDQGLNNLSGSPHQWQESTTDLMKMHASSDLAIGIGLLLSVFQIETGIAAVTVAVMALIAHLAIHFLTMTNLSVSHPMSHPLYAIGIFIYVVAFLLLAPFRLLLKQKRQQ
jgi:hypothetical protein